MKHEFSKDEYKAMVEWLMGDNVGASSKSILEAALGDYHNWHHPYDPSDFNRCLTLLEAVPSAWIGVKKMAEKHPKWAALKENWLEIRDCFEKEVGLNWTKGNNAPETYKLMQKVLQG